MVKLEIGCGQKPTGDFDGIDRVDFGQKYVGDALAVLKTFPNRSVEALRTEHFLEHLPREQVIAVLNECWRVLQPQQFLHVIVPEVNRKTGFWVLKHCTPFQEATFRDLERADSWPVYGIHRWIVDNVVLNKRGDLHVNMSPDLRDEEVQ